MLLHLLIDAGNSCIKLAAGEGGMPGKQPADSETRFSATDVIPTSTGRDRGALQESLKLFLARANLTREKLGKCLCASVVPWLEQSLAEAVEELCGERLIFVPKDRPVPLKNPYAVGQLGPDRLVAAYAARRLFPDSPEILCIGFGTATTFDCVCGDAYLGGLICPGVDSAAEGLALYAARLPRVALTRDMDTTRVIGTSTQECMQFGFLQGFAAMADGLADRIAHSRYLDTGSYPLVVATGGMAPVLAPACARLSHIVGNLVLEGLCFLAEEG